MVVVGMGELDLYLLGVNDCPRLVRFQGHFSPRWKADEEIGNDPATLALMRESGWKPESLQIQTSLYQLQLGFLGASSSPPKLDSLISWLIRLAELARPHLFDTNERCQDCGQNPSKLMFRRYLQGRYCSECAAERQSVEVALQQGSPPEDQSPQLAISSIPAFPVEEFERRYRANPGLYRLSLLGWVALGQLGLLGGAALILGGILLILGFGYLVVSGGAYGLAAVLFKVLAIAGAKLAVVLVAAVGALLSSLVAMFRLPSRVQPLKDVIGRRQAGPFFAWADGLARELKAPRLDGLVLDHGMSAAVMEQPTWFGYRRILMLGIPVLETFSREELEAIVSHELAHLRHGDPSSLWIYRTAESWRDLAARMQQEQGISVFAGFAAWYVPRFLARAKVVCRAQELSADREAARIQNGATALLKFEVVERLRVELVEPSMQAVLNQARAEQFDCINDLLPLIQQVPRERVSELVDEALLVESEWFNSHPSLSERLRNLQFSRQETLEFELSLSSCGRELFPDYEQLRERTMAHINGRMRLHLRGSVLTHRGRVSDLERLSLDLDSHPFAEERRLELALYARELRQDELAEEHLCKLVDCPVEIIQQVAREALIQLYLEQDRATQALPWLPESNLELSLKVYRRLRDWAACDKICQGMIEVCGQPEALAQLHARQRLYQERAQKTGSQSL